MMVLQQTSLITLSDVATICCSTVARWVYAGPYSEAIKTEFPGHYPISSPSKKEAKMAPLGELSGAILESGAVIFP